MPKSASPEVLRFPSDELYQALDFVKAIQMETNTLLIQILIHGKSPLDSDQVKQLQEKRDKVSRFRALRVETTVEQSRYVEQLLRDIENVELAIDELLSHPEARGQINEQR